MLARRALAGILLVLTAVGLVLLFVEARGSGATAISSAPPSVQAERQETELAAPVDVGAKRESEPHASGANAAGAPPPGEPSPALARLRGVLLLSSDRRPVAGAQLVFDFDTDVAEVVTDDQGRFTTEPVLPSGLVRAWHADVPSQKPYGVHLEIEPAQFLVPEPTAREPVHEIELMLMEPEAWLDVQVVANGAPTAAFVNWRCSVHPPGPSVWLRLTDSSGRLRVPVPTLAKGAEVELSARGEKARSRPTTVVYPWSDDDVRLELEPVGALRIHVRDEAGRALRGEYVRAQETHDMRTELRTSNRTDAGGQTVLELIAGPVDVFAGDSAGQKVWVPAGGVVELEFVLGPRDVLVAGRVVDENDQPLRSVGVAFVSINGGGRILTEEDGSFRLPRDADDELVPESVSVGGGADDDRYEPEEVVVPSGTTGLLFRRLPPVASVDMVFALLDAHTLAPLDEGRVFRYRARHPEDDPERTRDGLVTTSVKPAEDVRFLCRAPGYRERTFEWLALPEDARAGKPFRVLLEPGFEQTLQIHDAETDEPLVGARIFEGETLVATTDADGLARVALGAWPAPLRVTADGHDEGHWDCRQALDELYGWVWLEPGE